MHYDTKPTEGDAQVLLTGSLCDMNAQVLGSGRWDLWKKQLRHCLAEGVGDIAAEHISRAISSMESVEARDEAQALQNGM
jgi:hypothetical protein